MTRVRVWPHHARLQTLNLTQPAHFIEGENKVTELVGSKSKTRIPSLGHSGVYYIASGEHESLGLLLVYF